MRIIKKVKGGEVANLIKSLHFANVFFLSVLFICFKLDFLFSFKKKYIFVNK